MQAYFFLLSLLLKSALAIDAQGIRLVGNQKFRLPTKKIIFQPETTYPGELGSNCADGVRYWFSDKKNTVSNVVVTDISLLKIHQDPIKAIINTKLNDLACMNSVHTPMGEIKNINKGRFDEVVGFLALSAQDVGSAPPNELMLLARRDTKVYLLWEYIEPMEYKIAKCHTLWKNGPGDVEEKAFKALVNCYRTTIESDTVIQHKFQKISTEALTIFKE